MHSSLNEKRIERGCIPCRKWERRFRPQWKEDWKLNVFLLSFSLKEIQPQWKEDWKLPIPSPWVCSCSRLNEKRIERTVSLPAPNISLLPPQWKEDWKLPLRPGGRARGRLPQWKEDWKLLDTMPLALFYNCCLNEKRIERIKRLIARRCELE